MKPEQLIELASSLEAALAIVRREIEAGVYSVQSAITLTESAGVVSVQVVLSENRPCTTLYRDVTTDRWVALPAEDSTRWGTGSGHNQKTPKLAPGVYEFYAHDHEDNSYKTDVVRIEVKGAATKVVTAFLPPTVKPPQSPLVFPTRIGEQVREPVSGTIIECVSDYYGYAHDYSISSPENADGTLLMLHNYSTDVKDMKRNQDVIVRADTLSMYRDKGYDLGANRRWSYTNPDDLFCIPHSIALNGTTNRLCVYHPSTDQFELLHDFTKGAFAGYTMSFGQGGGTQDWSDRLMPVSADNGTDSYMIVYDLKARKIHSQVKWSTLLKRDAVNIPAGHRRKGNVIPTAGEDSSFTMTRDGKQCVVFRGGNGDIPFHSMYEVYNNNWSNRREIGALDNKGDWVTMHTSHAVTGVDLAGNQVLIGEQQPDQHHYITLDTPTIEFIRQPARAWGHTSASPALPGYASTYGYDIALDNPYFKGTIAMVLCPLRKTSDKPEFSGNDHGLPMYSGASDAEMRQYGYHRSKGIVYTSQPHAALTTKGDKLYFVSNNTPDSLPRGFRVRAAA